VQQTTSPSNTAQNVSLAWLLVLLLAQSIVMLATLVVAGIGRASVAQTLILVAGVGLAVAILLVLLVRQLHGTQRPVVSLLGIAVPIVDLLAFGIALGPASGVHACAAADAATLRSVATPQGIRLDGVPEVSQAGCRETFDSDVPPSDLLDDYHATLVDGGWSILSEQMPVASTSGVSAETGTLSAGRGLSRFWLAVQSGPDGTGAMWISGSITTDGDAAG